jgi:inner membrane protein
LDPLAHTLVGASLAETGLRSRTRLATPALIVGANLPDLDAIARFIGPDTMYGFRRGHTHGVVAMLLMPCVLTVLLLAYARLRPGGAHAPPLRARWLLALSALGVVSHPLLDWLNTYGVRLLMPFSDTWYYGDALFIADPWMWLSMASAVVLARSRTKPSMAAWLVLGAATSFIVLGQAIVPTGAKLVWSVAIVAIVLARRFARSPTLAPAVARVAVGALGVYIVGNLALSALARAEVHAWLQERGVKPVRVIAAPVGANPLKRDVIVVTEDHYLSFWLDWLDADRITPGAPAVPINDGPLSRAALSAPDIVGFAHWLRLPAFSLEPRSGGTRVWIRDVRYSRAPTSVGNAWVDLDGRGRPIGSSLSR